MGFSGSTNNGSSSISFGSDVALNNVANGQVLSFDTSIGKWKNTTNVASGVPATYALGRVLYNNGWPGVRPTGYAFIDWIKSTANDPDPGASLLIQGDTITEWQ